MNLYLQLYFEFFKTGLFAIGGGMATLPFLYDMSDRTGWFSAGQIADMIAVSESTPGPIGVNMATFAGFTIGGIPGAVIATLGLITPCCVIILLIAAFLQKFHENRFVVGAFYGLRPASTAMISAALLLVMRTALLYSVPEYSMDQPDWRCIALAAVLLLFTRCVRLTKKWHPIVFIGISALLGIVFRFARV